jgi:hypothetical protein
LIEEIKKVMRAVNHDDSANGFINETQEPLHNGEDDQVWIFPFSPFAVIIPNYCAI